MLSAKWILFAVVWMPFASLADVIFRLPDGLSSRRSINVVEQYRATIESMVEQSSRLVFLNVGEISSILHEVPRSGEVIYGSSEDIAIARQLGWHPWFRRSKPVMGAIFSLGAGSLQRVGYTHAFQPLTEVDEYSPVAFKTPGDCLRQLFAGLLDACATSPGFAKNYGKRFDVKFTRRTEPTLVFRPVIYGADPRPVGHRGFIVNNLEWQAVD